MENHLLLTGFVGLLFVYSLVSARLSKTIATAPMLFAIAGITAYHLIEPHENRMDADGFMSLAEIGLVLLLFADASRTDLRLLRVIRGLPTRLLSIGILLTILLGALAAKCVFPQLSWWEAGILAAILAPTDAGLGQVIVNSPQVPLRVRQALNIEAGLNDGLSVPFLLFFMAMAGTEIGEPPRFAQFVGEQLGLGIAIGAAIGLAGGWLLETARRHQWMADSFVHIAVTALPVSCILASEHCGASMFIAAFVAGLFVQVPFKHVGKHSVEFTEEWGQIINLAVFFLFGMIVGREWGNFGIAVTVYALLSLTVVRMVPVALALAGSGLDKRTVAFIGWFGPRGLASIVLGLVYLEQEKHLPGEEFTRVAVIVTVLLSILAHGISAQPGVRLLSRSKPS